MRVSSAAILNSKSDIRFDVLIMQLHVSIMRTFTLTPNPSSGFSQDDIFGVVVVRFDVL